MKRIGTWRKTWQKLLCGATALALVLSLLPVGVLAAEGEVTDEPTAVATMHYEPEGFDRVLLSSDALNSATGWTKTKGENNITFADESVTITGGGDNHIVWNEKIAADKFLISLDVTSANVPNEASVNGSDIKIELFKTETNNTGKRVQVRFKFKDSLAKICELETESDTACTENSLLHNNAQAFTWNPNEVVAIDVLVDKGADKITVYVNNEEVVSSTKSIAAYAQGYFGISGQYNTQNFTITNLSITAPEEETSGGEGGGEEEPTAPKHHEEPTFETTLLGSDALNSEEGWNRTGNAPGNFTVGGGVATTTGSGDSHIVWEKEIIAADKFLVSMDVTPGAISGGADFKIELFKTEKDNTGDRVQVRFKFQANSVKICEMKTESDTACDEQTLLSSGTDTFTWRPEEAIAIDVLVDKTADKITAYVNNKEVVSSTKSIAGYAQGYFGISGQYGSQNFTITNLSITTDEEPKTDPDPDPGTDPDPVDPPSTGAQHIEDLTGSDVRTLAEDDFNNGNASNWAVSNSTIITFSDGQVTFNGSGQHNRMGWPSALSANSFLAQFDVTPAEAAANGCDVKFEFGLGDNSYTGDRYRVRFQLQQKTVIVERTTSDNLDSTNNPTWTVTSSSASKFDWTAGQAFGVDIVVKDGKITVYKDAVQITEVDYKEKDGTSDSLSIKGGYFTLAGGWPNQQFTIDNLKITTDEARTGEPLPFTLTDSENGTVRVVDGAEKKEDGKYYAYPGDVVILEATASHGYVFDKWDTHTDGLLSVTNNRFTMVDDGVKFANLTITANFKAREASRFELWYDDFGYGTLNEANHTHNGKVSDNKYDMKDDQEEKDKITLIDGTLHLGAMTNGGNYVMIPAEVTEQLNGKNYRITVDVWMAEGAGTMQIMFNGEGSTPAERFANRAVLIINQNGRALFRVFTEGDGGDTFSNNPYTLGATPATLQIDVTGDTAIVYADGQEITRYTSPDNWGGRTPAVGLINMSSALTMGYDNLTVELLPDTVSISAKTTLNGQADNNYTAGTVVPNVPTAIAGDKITLETVVKAGYELEGFTAGGDYTGTVQFTENKDGTWSFTVPDDASGTITVTANFVPVALPTARGYYIDSSAAPGGDGTETHPWNSLIPLQTKVLNPGDTVYLKRGSVFNGQQLTFKGAGGTADKRITVTAYGTGDSLPRLNGQGAVTNVVELWNTPYVTIENLEITNTSPKYAADWSAPNKNTNKSELLRAINIYAKNFGVVSGITIRNCYIHEVNGTNAGKWNGGIFFDIQASGIIGGVSGTIHGIPTKYDSCLIENNTLINVDRSAIKLVSSVWCNQSPDNNNKTTPANWYPSTNMVVRGNYMEKIGGDGITVRDVDGALVEYNLAKDCNYQHTTSTYNVGIWPFEASNTVIQYNEAYNTHSTLDGQGLDCDHLSSYSVMQYNYSHNNEGGFMLIMGQYEHTSVTIRYNISQNDKDKLFEFTRGTPKGVMIYNNTFYSDTVISRGVMYLSNDTQKIGLNDVYLFNNLFYLPAGQPFYGGARANDIKTVTKPYNNGYVGGIEPPTEEANAIIAESGQAVLEDPGKGPATNEGVIEARTGSSGLLDGYQLAAGSPMIDKGVTVAEAIAHFNTSNLAIKDMKDKSPAEVYNAAYNNGNTKGNSTTDGNASIQYVNTDPIQLNGVNYNVDFFGNGIVGAPDIGAAEFGGTHVHVLEKVEAVEPTCETDGNIAYWHCANCGEYFADVDGEADTETAIDHADTVLAALGHDLSKVDEVPATTSAPGVKEHWTCETCGKLFEDEEGAHETTLEALAIPQLSSGPSTSPSTRPGNTGSNNTTKETVTTPEGVKGTTTKDRSGNVTSVEVAVPADVAGKGGVVTAPVEVESASSTDKAIGIDITVEAGSAKVEIPVTNVGYGTVAVVVDENGNETVLRDCVITADGVVLNVEGNVTVKIVENGKTFPDTVDVPWAEDAIAFTTARELFLGTGANFEPNSNTDRATIVTLLYRLEYEPDIVSVGFEDVVDDQWYANAVSWGQESGVVMGYTDASFGPEDPVTREQVALMLYRYATHIGMDTTARAELSGFVDGDQLSEWAADAMQWAVAIGLFTGHEGGFLDPTGNATRAQIAVLLMRFCEKKTLN